MNKIIIKLSSLQTSDRDWLQTARPDLSTAGSTFIPGGNTPPSPKKTTSTSAIITSATGIEEDEEEEGPTSPLRPRFVSITTASNKSPSPKLSSPSSSRSATDYSPSPYSPSSDPIDSADAESICSSQSNSLNSEDTCVVEGNGDFATTNTNPDVSFKNDNSTVEMFRFRSYCRKQLKKGPQSARKYYKCTHPGCKAKYEITENSDGSTTTDYKAIPHQHPPPPNPRTRKDVKDNAIDKMSVGAGLSVIHKQLINNAPLPLSSANVPTMAQLKHWKHQLSLSTMPSGSLLYRHFAVN